MGGQKPTLLGPSERVGDLGQLSKNIFIDKRIELVMHDTLIYDSLQIFQASEIFKNVLNRRANVQFIT
jgi:hypothetical protein